MDPELTLEDAEVMSLAITALEARVAWLQVEKESIARANDKSMVELKRALIVATKEIVRLTSIIGKHCDGDSRVTKWDQPELTSHVAVRG